MFKFYFRREEIFKFVSYVSFSTKLTAILAITVTSTMHRSCLFSNLEPSFATVFSLKSPGEFFLSSSKKSVVYVANFAI